MNRRLVIDSGRGAYHAGERHLVIHDGNPAGKTCVVHCHGRNPDFDDPGSGAMELSPQVPSQVFRNALYRAALAGIPVLCIDGIAAGWGNDPSRDRVLEGHAWMVDEYDVRADRLLLTGTSMGAMTALGVALEDPVLVRAVACFFPALDMDSATLGSYAAEMDTAYGGSASRTAAQPTHNPVQYAATFSVPSLLLYSTADALALPAHVDAFQAAATGCTKRAIAGAPAHVGGPISDADLDAVPAFLAAHD